MIKKKQYISNSWPLGPIWKRLIIFSCNMKKVLTEMSKILMKQFQSLLDEKFIVIVRSMTAIIKRRE